MSKVWRKVAATAITADNKDLIQSPADVVVINSDNHDAHAKAVQSSHGHSPSSRMDGK